MAKAFSTSSSLREFLDLKEDFTLYPCLDDEEFESDQEQTPAKTFKPRHWGNASSLTEQEGTKSTQSTKTTPQASEKRIATSPKATKKQAANATQTLPTPPATPQPSKRKLPKAIKREIAGKCKHRSSEGQLRCLQKRESRTGYQCSRLHQTTKTD